MLVYRQDVEILTETDYLYLEEILHLPYKDGIFYDELINSWKELNEKEFIKLD
jgi:hypothetical protein